MFLKITVPLSLLLSVNCQKYLFPEHADIFEHPNKLTNTYFGFAIQLQSSTNEKGRLLVGAPKSNSSFANHRDLVEPGVVFTCTFEPNNCQQLILDPEGDVEGEYKGTKYKDKKSHSSLGFALDADNNIHGPIIACASRWIDERKEENKIYNFYRENGICYYIKNSENNSPGSRLIPLLSYDNRFENNAYHYILGEAGFSAQLIQGSDTVLLGAIGLYNWTGSIIQYNSLNENNENFYVVDAKRKDKKIETYSYFSYAISYGRFNFSNKDQIFYVSGAPRNKNLLGSVNIFDPTINNYAFQNRYDLQGKQFGEYFGAAITVADINGDGTDDIIIGAPFYSTDEIADVGRIYVFLASNKQPKKINFQAPILYEQEESGRFGLAISSIGDINKDGKADIVVGAPYYQERGAIFLYFGSQNGLLLKQKILASECNPHLRGFGFSLSRGADIDNNYYNDIAVGSYLSSHVVVLKTRPVIKIETKLISSIEQIDINTKSLTIMSCLKYSGHETPNQLNILLNLNYDKNYLVFSENGNVTIIIYKDQNICKEFTAYVKEGVLHGLKIIMNYTILHQYTQGFCKSCPIEEQNQSKKIIIPFSTACASKRCKPNLKLFTEQNVTDIIIGSSESIEIIVTIENAGENSFGTKLVMEVSPYLHVKNAPNFCKKSLLNYTCDFNTPISSNGNRAHKFIFNVKNPPINSKSLNIKFFINSTGEDTNINDNYAEIKINLRPEVNIDISTKSDPEQILLSNKSDNYQIIHTYNIENNGITILDNFKTNLYFLYQQKDINIINNIQISGCSSIIEREIDVERKDGFLMPYLSEKSVNLYCFSSEINNFKCKQIQCEINNEILLKSHQINITFEANVTVLNEIRGDKESLTLISSLQLESEYFNKNYINIKTTLIDDIPKTANLTLYVVIGIIVGLILLLIVIAIFYKCGFFKRNKPPTNELDGEPLMNGKEVENEEKNKKEDQLENELYE